MNWLSQHGQHLTSLHMSGCLPLRQLPCPNLLELKLDGWDEFGVQLGPAADGSPGVIHSCTKLTRLEVSCNISDAPEGVVLDGNLSSLVHLQRLKVAPAGYDCWDEGYSVGGFSGATLPRLQHLTYLKVYGLSAENFGQLDRLSSLQKLHLYAADDTAVGLGSVPGLVFPASLKTLLLLHPVVVEAGLLSCVPEGLADLVIECDVVGPSEGPGSLLSSIAHLVHLTELFFVPTSVSWPPAGPAYSALAASSNLVQLRFVAPNLPDGIWSFVFPPTRSMPHLTRLRLGVYDVDFGHTESMKWAAGDLASLVRCCPGLCDVNCLLLQPGLDLSELRKLTALTGLCVDFDSSDSRTLDLGMQGLAALTQLESLDVLIRHGFGGGHAIKVASLLPLTSLRALRYLKVEPTHMGADEAKCSSNKWINTQPVSVLLHCRIRCWCAPEGDQKHYKCRSFRESLAAQRLLVSLRTVQWCLLTVASCTTLHTGKCGFVHVKGVLLAKGHRWQ